MNIKRALSARFYKWVDRKAKASNLHRLTQNKLYIFPSVTGFYFLAVIAVLWLLGTNYQNNMILALCFFMLSLFVLTILHTFANLANTEIVFKEVNPVFAGEHAHFTFTLTTRRPQLPESLQLFWQQDSEQYLEDDHRAYLMQENPHSATLGVPKRSTARGYLAPGRLLLQSDYPLGLLRCWTWLNWSAQALVYPKPAFFPLALGESDAHRGKLSYASGTDDFHALASYRSGDSLKHIAWKHYAREQGLYTKTFSRMASSQHWLDYSCVEAPSHEAKLSALCYWVLHFDALQQAYGLILPDVRIAPESGESHKHKVLTALALSSAQ